MVHLEGTETQPGTHGHCRTLSPGKEGVLKSGAEDRTSAFGPSLHLLPSDLRPSHMLNLTRAHRAFLSTTRPSSKFLNLRAALGPPNAAGGVRVGVALGTPNSAAGVRGEGGPGHTSL